jgi:hypothetical protein
MYRGEIALFAYGAGSPGSSAFDRIIRPELDFGEEPAFDKAKRA